jgi:transcriptional regulator with PAS, ATPase and Fis domain
MEEKQAWTTCLFTDILLSHLDEIVGPTQDVDYPALFQGLEGIEIPTNPDSFFRDVTNWVPLSALRELMLQCERISAKRDFSYHAGRAYFAPGKRELPSLFEIIVRVLNDVRSVLICANLWGAVQTNYLRLQSFETNGEDRGLYLLAQFDDSGGATVRAMQLLRGICEGFSRLYPFIEEVQCADEISQLRMEDIVREFPGFVLVAEVDHLAVRHGASGELVAEARKVPLKVDFVPLSKEFIFNMPTELVVPEEANHIRVLSHHEETDPKKRTAASMAYKITKPGVLIHDTLSHTFGMNQIYNAPYSRLRFALRERQQQESQPSVDEVRQKISGLLFEHLRQIKHAHTRAIQGNVEKRRLTLENIRLRREIEREYSFSGIVGQSEKIKDLLSLVKSAAETDVTVLIQGETGTGKELIARAIHYNSPRRAKRFVAINCGALSETLLESELFGHEKGAFTGATMQRKGIFETADGGTLLLDEIGEISPSTQVKLLRVLQEGELQRVGGSQTIQVDVRIVAATNQNLADLVGKGRVRQDLFYRLNVFPITVPPLRERIEDIPLLVSHFIEKSKEKLRREVKSVSPQAMALLMVYSWPGNVRELQNALQRAMVIVKGEILDVDEFPNEIGGGVTPTPSQPRNLKGIARDSSEMIEKRTILDALSKTGGNITHAAKALGISRATLQNKMKLYGLRRPNIQGRPR